MKLLTFLGVANYQETCYTWNNLEFTSRFAPSAACHFLQPEKLIVFLTEDAQEKVFDAFQGSLPQVQQIRPVAVPLGGTEQELWEIFTILSATVEPGEEVAFDITHGFRSFPLLGLLAAAYLRSAMDVKLRAVLYGAFDAGRVVSPGKTPMFDLTPMLSLLEWADAADRFNRTGNSRYLASLLKSQRKNLVLMAQGNLERLKQVGTLDTLAEALDSISQSLQLIRPHLVMQEVRGLQERIDRARPALDQAAPAQPFTLLLERIVETYLPLAQDQPRLPENLPQTLEVERTLIRWYADRLHWVQAVSLAREWLVSWMMFHMDMDQVTQLNLRHRVENIVGAESSDFISAKKEGKEFNSIFLKNMPDIEKALDLWNRITSVRNDIDHAGMRDDPLKPAKLIMQINDCLTILEELPLQKDRP